MKGVPHVPHVRQFSDVRFVSAPIGARDKRGARIAICTAYIQQFPWNRDVPYTAVAITHIVAGDVPGKQA